MTRTQHTQKNYRILRSEIIGKGATSTVYKGYDRVTKEEYAFKLVNLSRLPCVAKRQSKQELQLLQKLNHLRSTPEIIDTIQRGAEICFVMKLIQGKKMSYLLKKYPNGISDSIAPFLFKSILMAVGEIHNAGVCHLNLSLNSLMFDTVQSTIKIVNFRSAKETRFICDGISIPVYHRDFCGSIPYAAPEVVAQEEYDGTKVDIWSVGVIFYVLMFNQLPFEHFENDADAIFRKISRVAIYYPPNISPDLRSLFENIFTADPDARLSAKELLEHPFFFCTRKYIKPWV
mmetsp:Transcript_51455/g.78152  ORF Transcript_51455/g.78152 Transcript_51455/m.78152 type:complete len:288 (+) Transcript_51455:22-885(+)